jgi:uncharacterized protein (TIGR02996 family)
MTRYNELLSAVTNDPEDDTARLAFAQYIRQWEPDRAEFIEQQLKQAQHRRQVRGPRTNTDNPFLLKHEAEWTRIISKYTTRWIFDRGFITLIRIDPYLFLEYGEWLFLNAPIRIVEFSKPVDGSFPMSELTESSLLSRLDSIGFHDETLERDDIEHIAASQYLERLLVLDSINLKIDNSIYSILATNPQLRKALGVRVSREGFPGQSYEETGEYDMQDRAVYKWTDLTPQGKALEARYGYLPWLHEENICDEFDAAWYVANGILPVKPPGSPVG